VLCVGYADSLNLYSFVGNNPLTWADPFGLCKGSGYPFYGAGLFGSGLPGSSDSGGFEWWTALLWGEDLKHYGRDVANHFIGIATAPGDYYWPLEMLESGLSGLDFRPRT